MDVWKAAVVELREKGQWGGETSMEVLRQLQAIAMQKGIDEQTRLELVQTVAMKLTCTNKYAFANASCPKSYMFKVLENTIVDLKRIVRANDRATKKYREELEVRARIDDSPSANLVAEEKRQSVVAAIDKLGKEDRQLIHWFYYLDKDLDYISDQLELDYATVAKRLSRARSKLRKHISKKGQNNVVEPRHGTELKSFVL